MQPVTRTITPLTSGRSRKPRRASGFDVTIHYLPTLEIALLLSLAELVELVRAPIAGGDERLYTIVEQERVQLKEDQ